MALVRAGEIQSKRKAGGDGTVDRDDEGRPRLLTTCWIVGCDGGRKPSPKVPGNTVKCQGCNGTGIRGKTYKRVTSFIDVLEDKSFVQAWIERMVLIGCAEDMGFLTGVLDVDPETREGKDLLNRRAQAAKDLGGANRKSDRGTYLHDLSERVDRHEALPEGTPECDVLDMEAYRKGTHPFFGIKHMEELVVNERLGVAGTPDRVSHWIGEGELVAPDGSIIGRDELLITDLKTGRVDFGGLKMAMQLFIYSDSELNVPDSHIRKPFVNINTKWGIIMHLAAGSGVMNLYWADLSLGMKGVSVVQDVHAMRKVQKHALIPLSLGTDN